MHIVNQAVFPLPVSENAGKHNLQLAVMGRAIETEMGFPQANRLAYVPAGKTVPDHQEKLPEEVIWIKVLAAMLKTENAAAPTHLNIHHNVVAQQPIKIHSAVEQLGKTAAVSYQITHRLEGAHPATLGAKAHELITQLELNAFKESRHLVGMHPALFIGHQQRVDTSTNQQALLDISLGHRRTHR